MDIDEVTTEPPSHPALAALNASQLFDDRFYERARGTQGSRLDHIAHYLAEGERAGLKPSVDFDPAFYSALYTDVALAGTNLLAHFIEYGQAEGRYRTLNHVRADALKIRGSGLLAPDERGEAGAPSGRVGMTMLEAHIALLWKSGHRITRNFDDRAYTVLVGLEATDGQSPLNHFLANAWLAGARAPAFSPSDYNEVAGVLDMGYYRRERPDMILPDDPVLDYLTFGRWTGASASPTFQQDHYLERYPDVGAADIEPYLHYLKFGAAEGRVGRPQFDDRIVAGEQRFDPGRDTILVASHEASRTGAPLVALAVGEYLSTSFNVVYSVGRTGPIEEDFRRSSVAIVKGNVPATEAPFLLAQLRRDYGLTAAVLNSVETYELAEGALMADLPTVGLIHEFSEYSAGRIGRMVAAVDRGILPARLLLESAQAEMVRDYAAEANNLMVHPQGCLPRLPETKGGEDLTEEEILAIIGTAAGTKPRIVLGAGFVHIRKGVDLFAQTAAAVRAMTDEPVRFIWVGHGFDPERDHHYSLWIKDMIKRLDLEEVMYFFDPQGSLDVFLQLTDVFFLSSRLDPFPNVVLDALEAGRPVVCFDKATGAAELLNRDDAVGATVGFCDTQAAARAIVDLLRRGKDVGLSNAALMRDQFAFEDYGALIVEQLEEAKRLRARQLAVYDRIAATPAFDATFHDGGVAWGAAKLRSLKRYVSRGTKGLSRTNPRPGFSDNLYKSRAGLPENGHEVALDHAIRILGNVRPTTHRCVTLTPDAIVHQFSGKIAVHLHLYYAELASEFRHRLQEQDREVDVFVTTGKGTRRAQVELAFASYRRGTVTFLEVPNRGRDIGPFMTLLGEPILANRYDLVGHFHGKKSAAVEGIVPGLGDRWRRFLVDSLLGSRHELNQLLGLFTEDPKLGLVFAEDRNAVGWADNLPIAQELAARMRPEPTLPSAPFYPLGNMFWARPEAVLPVWDLRLGWTDYPPEPLPYDGTVLHAIERMLPSICEATGHHWLTVHQPGRYW